MAFRNCVVDQAHRGELHWVRNDLERAHLAAQRIDIRHARHRTQGGPDHPVEQLRRSSSDISLDSTVNMNISPSGVVIGAMPPLMPQADRH